MSDKVRWSIPVTPEIKTWYDETARELGYGTTTAFVIYALREMMANTEKAKQAYQKARDNVMDQIAQNPDNWGPTAPVVKRGRNV